MNTTNLSGNKYTTTWLEGDWIYKRQHAHLAENEWWCLDAMRDSGYVPFAERVDLNTVRMAFVQNQHVTDPGAFMVHRDRLLICLARQSIRHGDLTVYAVLVHDNKPILIDFGESRMMCDPRKDKRPQGDAYWLDRTMKILAGILPYPTDEDI